MSVWTTVKQWFQTPLRYKRAVQSVAALWLGALLGGVLAFATQTILARVLGVAEFGSFSAALASVTLVAPLAGFGLGGFWLNVFGKEGWVALRWLPDSFRFSAISTALTVLVLWIWAWIGPHERRTTYLLLVLTVHVFGQLALELTSAKFQLEGRHLRLALLQTSAHVLRFAGVLLLLIIAGQEAFSAEVAALTYAAVALLISFVGGYELVTMARGRLLLEGHDSASLTNTPDTTERPGAFRVASLAWPFGLAGVLYLIYYQSDLVLLRYFVNESAVGFYNAAVVVMTAIYLFPSALYQKFLLPRLHRWAYHDAVKLQMVYSVGNFSMVVVGSVILIVLWLLAPFVLPWFFGREYIDAVPLVRILALGLPLFFLASSSGAVLVTRHHIRVKVGIMALTALFNVILNLFLIPAYGASGAAVATVLSYGLLSMLYVHNSRRVIQSLCGSDGGEQ